MAWWAWTLGGVLAWVVLAAVAAAVIGRSIRLAEEDDRCRGCGHSRTAHQHYRAGSDCALCDCGRLVAAPRQAVFWDMWHRRTTPAEDLVRKGWHDGDRSPN